VRIESVHAVRTKLDLLVIASPNPQQRTSWGRVKALYARR